MRSTPAHECKQFFLFKAWALKNFSLWTVWNSLSHDLKRKLLLTRSAVISWLDSICKGWSVVISFSDLMAAVATRRGSTLRLTWLEYVLSEGWWLFNCLFDQFLTPSIHELEDVKRVFCYNCLLTSIVVSPWIFTIHQGEIKLKIFWSNQDI